MKKEVSLPLISLLMEKLKIFDVYDSLERLNQVFKENDQEKDGRSKKIRIFFLKKLRKEMEKNNLLYYF